MTAPKASAEVAVEGPIASRHARSTLRELKRRSFPVERFAASLSAESEAAESGFRPGMRE